MSDEQPIEGWYEFPACNETHHDRMVALRPVLKDWLQKNPGEHQMSRVCKTLGWRKGDVHRCANEFRSVFVLRDSCSKHGTGRATKHKRITLHPHFRMPHA